MAKLKSTKEPANKPAEKNPAVKKPNYILYIFIIVAVIAAGYYIYSMFAETEPKPGPKIPVEKKEATEPQFKKQGEVEFISGATGKPIKTIDVEIADNDRKRSQGLMFRKSMEENQGMYFVFPISEPQSFWMKNTIISLDIMFINENKEIVKIHKNTTPHSEKSLPSGKNAMYVVEVIAGFSDKFGIKEGDKIIFKVTNY